MLDLVFWLMFLAALPAGIGGALAGDRAVAWVLARSAGREG